MSLARVVEVLTAIVACMTEAAADDADTLEAVTTTTDAPLSLVEAVVPVGQLQDWAQRALAWAQGNLLTIDVALQLGLLLGAIVPAALLGPRLRRWLTGRFAGSDRLAVTTRLVETLAILATPLALYATLTLFRIALGGAGHSTLWLDGAQALLTAWIIVRCVTLLIRSAFWSRVAFYVAWPIAALDAFGALDPVVEQLRALALPLGENSAGQPVQISLLDVLRTLFYFLILFWASSLLNQFLAQRIRSVEELSPSPQSAAGQDPQRGLACRCVRGCAPDRWLQSGDAGCFQRCCRVGCWSRASAAGCKLHRRLHAHRRPFNQAGRRCRD